MVKPWCDLSWEGSAVWSGDAWPAPLRSNHLSCGHVAEAKPLGVRSAHVITVAFVGAFRHHWQDEGVAQAEAALSGDDQLQDAGARPPVERGVAAAACNR